MDNKQDIEWGIIQRNRRKDLQAFDREHKQKILVDKTDYKNDLDLQTQLKQQDRSFNKEVQKKDIMAIQLQNKLMEKDEFEKKAEKIRLQKYLADQYSHHSSHIKGKQQLEYQKSVEEDNRKNKRIEDDLIQERILKQEDKKRLLDEETRVLKRKRYEDQVKEQEVLKEKKKDLEMFNKRIDADNARERKYKEFYKNIEEKQNRFQNAFAKEISTKIAEKEQNLVTWVEKNIEQKLKMQNYKEMYEQKLKKDNINNVKSVWKHQMEEKQRKIQGLKEEQKNLYETIQKQVSESRKLSEMRENQKRIQQSIYKEHLLGQLHNKRHSVSNANEENYSFDKYENRSKYEIGSNRFNSRSNSVSHNEHYKESPLPFQKVLGSERVRSGSGSELSQYSLHNPITNPIGSHSPKPIERPLFKPHTLIAY